ncbi:hypothetical protein [Halomicrococcus sp. NG-SE-24]|uniref:hypothetical protein n=1 Tax=Halomicrococcus sp. NG-SE-24 TaxID=3436928 RepID=UPI003D95804C
MLCPRDVFEPADEVVLPVVSQFVVCGVDVGAGLRPGVEVGEGVGVFGDGFS